MQMLEITSLQQLLWVQMDCTNLMIIPLANTESCTFNTHTLHDGAMPYTDFIINHEYYDGMDTDYDDMIQIEDNIFVVAEDTLHSLRNTDTNLAQFLLVTFEEDISSYFAE